MEKKRILVVEDEPAMRRMVAVELAAAGYEVLEADNGAAALNLVEATKPDLIISDVLMPQLDGYKFYQELKKREGTSDIPVLILTARGKMEDSFRVAGVDEFIAKPFQSEDLLAKVAGLLTRSEKTAGVAVNARVLVVGNDAKVVESMTKQLKSIGCLTESAESGGDAISKAVTFAPKIVILEAQMEGMSSPEIIGVLRKMANLENVPVIIYSHYQAAEMGTDDARQKALTVDISVSNCEDAGATGYIGSFSEVTFLNKIGKHLT